MNKAIKIFLGVTITILVLALIILLVDICCYKSYMGDYTYLMHVTHIDYSTYMINAHFKMYLIDSIIRPILIGLMILDAMILVVGITLFNLEADIRGSNG